MGLSGVVGRRLYTKLFTTANYSSTASNEINLIKQLRERTSAPIKDVKAALVASNWDLDDAQTELRKKGIVLASKKSSRTASEGLLALAQNHHKTALIELNCETDFVSRNDIFQHLARSLANQALLLDTNSSFHFGPQSLQEMKLNLEHPKINGETTVQNAITEVAAIMGENVKLRRGYVMHAPSNGLVSTYLHTSPLPGLGRIAGILSLEVDGGKTEADALQRVGSELAMHVVAAKPLFLTKELVSVDALEYEREILKSQAEASGKPQMAIDRMVEGRLRKYFENVVLMDQKFVINDTIKVKEVLDNLSKEVGSSVRVVSFLRMEVGEGIARQKTDSSESVAQVA